MKNCVYRFLNKDNEVIYIGKAKDLKLRLRTHSHLSKECYEEKDVIEFIEFDTVDDMNFAERYYIMKFKPKYNTILADKSVNMSLTELDIKIWNRLNKKHNTHSVNSDSAYVEIGETKEYLINKLELIREKIEFAHSFIRENDINIFNTNNFAVKRYDALIDEEKVIKSNIEKLLKEEGVSSRIVDIFIQRGVYTKEGIIKDDIKKIEDTIYNKCEEDILKYGYYKFKNYYRIEEFFSADRHNLALSEFYDFKTIENYIFECKEIDIKVRQEFTDRIIENIEKRLSNKFGKLKKEVIFIDGYSEFLSTLYPTYKFVCFQEPCIILKPIIMENTNN